MLGDRNLSFTRVWSKMAALDFKSGNTEVRANSLLVGKNMAGESGVHAMPSVCLEHVEG